MHMKNNKNTR